MKSALYELIDIVAGWRMPIHVNWLNSANAEVTIADIPLLQIQRQAIEAKLNASATHRHPDGTKWYVAVRALNDIADKSMRADPEQVVVWSRPEPVPDVRVDFVHAYCAQPSAVIRSPATFAPIWASIQQFILHWLVDQGRSLDLHFGRLDAFPLRCNWKNAIIGRIYKNRIYVRHYTAGQWEFMRACLHRERLTAYDRKSGTMRWSCEFTPNEAFYAATIKREEKRKEETDANGQRRWKNNYLGQIMHLIRKDLKERMYENLVAYAKETDYPFAVFPLGCGTRRPPKGFQPTFSSMEWYQTPLVTLPSVVEKISPTIRESESFKCDAPWGVVVAEDASVPEMPGLQSGGEDMRNAGSEMDATW